MLCWIQYLNVIVPLQNFQEILLTLEQNICTEVGHFTYQASTAILCTWLISDLMLSGSLFSLITLILRVSKKLSVPDLNFAIDQSAKFGSSAVFLHAQKICSVVLDFFSRLSKQQKWVLRINSILLHLENIDQIIS